MRYMYDLPAAKVTVRTFDDAKQRTEVITEDDVLNLRIDIGLEKDFNTFLAYFIDW